MPNCYEILGLTAGAAPEQVKTAFHTLAKSSHPDVNASDATAAKRFNAINEAYEVLSDPEKRAVYDLGLRHERAETRWRFWNTMVVTTASFTIVVGCGLYFWLHHSGRPIANAHEPTDFARNSSRPTPQTTRDDSPGRGERSGAASSTEFSDVMVSGRASGAPPVQAVRVLASAPTSRTATEPLVPGHPVTPTVVETGKATVAIATPDPSPSTPIPKVAHEQAPPTAEPLVKVGSSTPTTHRPEKPTATNGPSGPAPSTPDVQADRAQALHLYAMGMEHIGRGDVIAARSLFLLAAKKGSVRSMRALAGTYDPVQLDKLKVLGMNSNFDAAREWYEKVGDHDAIAAAEQVAREEEAADELRKLSKPSTNLAQFRAAYISGDGLAYVVVDEETGEEIYRYGDPSRSKAKKNAQAYTLFLCETPFVFTPRKPEDLAALLRATVVNPGDSEFDQLDGKYRSACPGARSAIPRD